MAHMVFSPAPRRRKDTNNAIHMAHEL